MPCRHTSCPEHTSRHICCGSQQIQEIPRATDASDLPYTIMACNFTLQPFDEPPHWWKSAFLYGAGVGVPAHAMHVRRQQAFGKICHDRADIDITQYCTRCSLCTDTCRNEMTGEAFFKTLCRDNGEVEGAPFMRGCLVSH